MATSNAARSSRLLLVLSLTLALVACGLWLDDEAMIERAQVALDNEQYSAAIIDLKAVLQNAPDNAAARKLLGRALAASGEFEAAENHLQRALDQGQPLDEFRLALAEARLETGQAEQALVIADPTAAADDKEAFYLWLYRGDAQAELGGIVDALRSYEQAKHLDIDKAMALLRAAEIYWNAGNLEDAKAFTELALVDDPDNLDAHLTLGPILLEMEKPKEAEEKLTHTLTALQLDPEDRGYILGSLVEAHLAQENVAAAREASERVAELWSADDTELRFIKAQIAMAEGDDATAATELSAYLAEFPESEAAARMLAAAKLGQGLFNMARTQLVRDLNADPDQAETRILLARAYLAAGQVDQSRDVLEPVLELVPRDPIALSLLGVLSLHTQAPELSDDPYTSVRDQLIRGKNDHALAIAHAAVSDDQINPRALNLLGLCQLANGQAPAAAESILRALAAEPDNDRLRLNLVRAHLGNSASEDGLRVLEEIGATDLSDEISVLRRALVINLHESNYALGRYGPEPLSRWLREDPDDQGARLLLAQTYIEMGSFADAAAQYELLLELELGDPVIHNNLAWSYLQLNDNRAAEQAEYAYQLAPNDGQIVDTLGWVLVSQGDLERGPSLLADAHILQPGDPAIAYHLAYALSRAGAKGEATAMLEGLLEREADPVDELVRALLSELQQDQ
ncbi:MAG: tetratricopeptide repeat protein [Woeseiaceae bacterium]